MKWKGKLINNIIEQLKDDSQWGNTIEKMLLDTSVGIHLAIFNEPFLSLVYSKEKKIESRFSMNKISPFEKVRKGDVIILKESGGLVNGVFVAGEVKFYQGLNKKFLNRLNLFMEMKSVLHTIRIFGSVEQKQNMLPSLKSRK
jgi:ASC-1-like (ASCH) protein